MKILTANIVVVTDVTAELVLQFVPIEEIVIAGDDGNTIDPEDEIVSCNKFEVFCCGVENIVDGLVS